VSKTHKTAVVVIPPRSLWPRVQEIRQQHDHHFRRWMPHITLLYPFRPQAEFAALTEPLRQACSGLRPFQVELNAFQFFQHGPSYTIWLAPEPKDSLQELQATLWRVVPDCDDTRRFQGGYTPHLSVGQVQGRGRVESLLRSLQEHWEPLRFEVSQVSLIWRRDPPDDVFRVAQELELGQSSQAEEEKR
jgi:2'-5' RNA ligase